MQQDNPPLTLTIPSEPRMLSVARAFVEAACQIAKLDKPMTHAVVLASGEAFSNVIRHAHQSNPDAHLQIQCWLSPQSIEICFHDQGEPFDVASVPEMDPTELRIGGRGVYLMRKLMDELKSIPRKQGGNTLKMVKRLQPIGQMREVG